MAQFESQTGGVWVILLHFPKDVLHDVLKGSLNPASFTRGCQCQKISLAANKLFFVEVRCISDRGRMLRPNLISRIFVFD